MTENASSNDLLELTAEVTAAWLSNPKHKLRADQLPKVIESIYGALAGASASPVRENPEEHIPAVSVRRSLASREHIVSLIDGRPYKMLKRHLSGQGLTPDEYRQRYNLKPDYPMVAPAYAAERQAIAKKIGLGRKPKAATAKPKAKSARGRGRPRKTEAQSPAAAAAAPAPAAAEGENNAVPAMPPETSQS